MKKLTGLEKKNFAQAIPVAQFAVAAENLNREFADAKAEFHIAAGGGWWIIVSLGPADKPGWRELDNPRGRRALKRRAAEILGVPKSMIKLSARYSCLEERGDYIVRKNATGQVIGTYIK